MKNNSIYKNVEFQEPPYEDTGNHIVNIPSIEAYSKQKGLLHSIPELEQLIQSRNLN